VAGVAVQDRGHVQVEGASVQEAAALGVELEFPADLVVGEVQRGATGVERDDEGNGGGEELVGKGRLDGLAVIRCGVRGGVGVGADRVSGFFGAGEFRW
jgi:hypothetical protein